MYSQILEFFPNLKWNFDNPIILITLYHVYSTVMQLTLVDDIHACRPTNHAC